jgi:adenosylcobyric acid synthase
VSARPLFIGGTSSNAGKSWMATAICASLRRRGIAVAPFKAQNMSNHSYPCRAGGEIGRAQVAQAEACGLEPEPAMNPILLKPAGGASQVIVHGNVWKTLSPREYYEHVDELRLEVISAYETLAQRFDVIVIEGAGSMSEINLRQVDLVNLWLVTALKAPWLLVADIERGGVFGSVVGTAQLLTADERALFRGFAINKFRGDMSLFDDGVPLLETRAQSACLGVFPYLAGARLDAEDSLAVPTERIAEAPAGARVAIVRLPHLSNATDFRHIAWADWVTSCPVDDYDFVILPGTKNTLGDLQWLRDRQLDVWVRRQHDRGATVIGVCGGFQMLGRVVSDPDAVESRLGQGEGLGFIAADTIMRREKTTRLVSATTPGGARFHAYEIHQGSTSVPTSCEPFARLDDGTREGVRLPRVIGTYLHGAFEDAAVCSEILGVPVDAGPSKRSEYDRLADWFDRHARVDPMALLTRNETFTGKS